MKYYFIQILTLVFLILNLTVSGQSNFEDINAHIFSGNIQLAKKKLDKKLNQTRPVEDKILLNKLLGDVFLIEGNIDAAYSNWKKSNELRKSIYSANDYRLAWNYALLSNYHYEKINTQLAIEYADSCLHLLSGLSLQQQREIEVFKIWNILGQSLKQSAKVLTFKQTLKIYQSTQSYYLKSIDFIKANNINEEYLAITYRLLGNSYLDLAFQVEPSDTKNYYQLSSNYYKKSISIWKRLYGSKHYELARTYFVQGLLNYYVKGKLGFNSYKHSIDFFEKSFNAYGIDLTGILNDDLDKIPNKEGFLMTCKYLTTSYLKEFEKESSVSWLDKAQKVNNIAVNIWENIHQSFEGVNTNQNLAIYSLVPFSETIILELYKKELKHNFSIDSVFSATQKLKYYDLLKYSSKQNGLASEITISELQHKLYNDEVFLDFHISSYVQGMIVLRITKQSAELIEFPPLKHELLQRYLSSIENLDFDAYTKSAYAIYQTVLKPCMIENNNLVLCLDGPLYNLPFEALLTSKENWDKKDYRQLDYLLKRNKIQYVLNPQLFRNTETDVLEYQTEAFIPNNTRYSSLPFSHQLGIRLKEQFNAKVYLQSEATKKSFLNMKSPIIHLSGHAVISNEEMFNSYLALSDSFLYLDDLSRLRHPPTLMVLNTCNSANGKMYSGEGVHGFVRAFNLLGTKSTLSNLWEVDDQASNQLLEQFYNSLSNGNSTTESLQKTQMSMILKAKNSKMAAPYYWAGHRLTGENTSFKEKEKNGIWWYWLIGFIGLCVVVFMFMKNHL